MPRDFTQPSEGNGGSVEIFARQVSFLDGGVINATTFTNGDGGAIRIEANELTISGPDLGSHVPFRQPFERSFVAASSPALGWGGDIVFLGVGEDT